METIMKIAVILAISAFASGNIEKVVRQVRLAQIQLILETKASKWPKALQLKN